MCGGISATNSEAGIKTLVLQVTLCLMNLLNHIDHDQTFKLQGTQQNE